MTRAVLAATELSLVAVAAFFSLAFGLVAGSFVNVLIYRLPRDRPVVTPRSHCFACGRALANVDLIPLVSYLRAGRCCRYCGAALSGQYLWVEAACGLLYAVLMARFGLGLGSIVLAACGTAMLAALVIDLRHRVIPGVLPAAIALFGLAGSLLSWLLPELAGRAELPPPGWSLAGLALGYLVFEGIVRLGRWIFGQEAMGGGDVLLAAAVGTLTGPGRGFLAFVLISILAGAAYGLGLMLTGRFQRRMAMPFGPFLIAGALTVLLAPPVVERIARWYGMAPRM